MDTEVDMELPGYCAKYSFLTETKGLTMREAERIFSLTRNRLPGKYERYIIEAVRSRELRWFSFSCTAMRNRLNGRVRCFLLREGLDRYDPGTLFRLQNELCACHAGLPPGIRSRTRSRFSDLCPIILSGTPF